MTQTRRQKNTFYDSIFKAVIGSIVVISCFFSFPSCVHDPIFGEGPSPTDTLPDTIRDTSLIRCDTTNGISFKRDLQPIFAICINCHGPITNNSGIRVDTYLGVKDAIATGRLLGALRWENGFIRMPLDLPQLVGCDLKKIEIWIRNGAVDN